MVESDMGEIQAIRNTEVEVKEQQGKHVEGVLKGHRYHHYTAQAQERENLLHAFGSDYHGEHITHFCCGKRLSRLTFRNW